MTQIPERSKATDLVRSSKVDKINSPYFEWSAWDEAREELESDGEVASRQKRDQKKEENEKPGHQVAEWMEKYIEVQLPDYAFWEVKTLTATNFGSKDTVSYVLEAAPEIDFEKLHENIENSNYSEFTSGAIDYLGARVLKHLDEEKYRELAGQNAADIVYREPSWKISGKVDQRSFEQLTADLSAQLEVQADVELH